MVLVHGQQMVGPLLAGEGVVVVVDLLDDLCWYLFGREVRLLPLVLGQVQNGLQNLVRVLG